MNRLLHVALERCQIGNAGAGVRVAFARVGQSLAHNENDADSTKGFASHGRKHLKLAPPQVFQA